MPANAASHRNDRLETSPTARRLLKAARRVILRKGHAALTNQAVAQESRLRSSLIHYHFGGKSGLVSALIDEEITESSGTPNRRDADAGVEGPARLKALLDDQQRVSADTRDYRVFYELLPTVLRNKAHREQLALGYEAYRNYDADIIRSVVRDVDEVTLDRLVALGIALVDGLSLQASIDPERFDHAGAYALWEEMFFRTVGVDATDRSPLK